jgi:hypothetical protein
MSTITIFHKFKMIKTKYVNLNIPKLTKLNLTKLD